MNRPDYWLSKFSKLRVDRARGDPAPHKPLLLLALCDLAEQGALPHGTLPLSPELAFRFYTYWTIVAGRRHQRPDIVIPSRSLVIPIRQPTERNLALNLAAPICHPESDEGSRSGSLCPFSRQPKQRPSKWTRLIQERPLDIRSRALIR